MIYQLIQIALLIESSFDSKLQRQLHQHLNCTTWLVGGEISIHTQIHFHYWNISINSKISNTKIESREFIYRYIYVLLLMIDSSFVLLSFVNLFQIVGVFFFVLCFFFLSPCMNEIIYFFVVNTFLALLCCTYKQIFLHRLFFILELTITVLSL